MEFEKCSKNAEELVLHSMSSCQSPQTMLRPRRLDRRSRVARAQNLKSQMRVDQSQIQMQYVNLSQ